MTAYDGWIASLTQKDKSQTLFFRLYYFEFPIMPRINFNRNMPPVKILGKMPIKTYLSMDEVMRMGRKKKASMEERIEQFCKSSGELLAGINAKYSSGNKQKKKRKKKSLTAVPGPDPDFHDEELLESRF